VGQRECLGLMDMEGQHVWKVKCGFEYMEWRA
jgi:hypothetical protein